MGMLHRGILMCLMLELNIIILTSIDTTSMASVLQRDDEDVNPTVMDAIMAVNQDSKSRRRNLFEGDINMSERDQKKLKRQGKQDGPAFSKRGQIRSRVKIWRTRTIPYTISPKLNKSKHVILSAMKEIERLTCLKFREWDGKKRHYIKFVKKRGCWSSVGRKYKSKNGQNLSLGKGCLHRSIILHELNHALGFWHEQSRPDRDKYIEILWENIKEKKQRNFKKHSNTKIDNYSPYDIDSMMHYGSYTFSKNGLPTIREIKNPDLEIGEKHSLTDTDVLQINVLYNCKVKGEGWSEWSNYSPCDLKCRRTRERFCMSPNVTDCPGADKKGLGQEDSQCTPVECYAPIDGHWGRWGRWSWCHPHEKSQVYGRRTKERKCDNPKRRYGGKKCKGIWRRKRICKIEVIGPQDNGDHANKTSIHTKGGTAYTNDLCFFPFQYEGKKYSGCIDKHAYAQHYWCGTTKNVDRDQMWGFCKFPRKKKSKE